MLLISHSYSYRGHRSYVTATVQTGPDGTGTTTEKAGIVDATSDDEDEDDDMCVRERKGEKDRRSSNHG